MPPGERPSTLVLRPAGPAAGHDRWRDRIADPLGLTMLAVLAVALVVAAVLFAVEPIPGRDYVLVFRSTALLLPLWCAWATLGRWRHDRWILGLCAVAGGAWSVYRLFEIDADAEIVRTYRSLFAALDRGINPYNCSCIVHLVEDNTVRFGGFNYPPAEIWPYRLVEQVLGSAGVQQLTGTWFALNLAAFAILALAVRRALGWRIVAFLPFLVVWELQTNIATTMVVVAGIVSVHVAEQRAPRRWHRPALWVLMGIGLATKFVVVPLYGVWWLARARHQVELARTERHTNPVASGLRASALDFLAPLAVAILLGAPFGVGNVLRETVLFNLGLGTRDELTTFYPNVLSGALEWAGVAWLYPVLALALLAAAVLTALRIGTLTAMFVVTIVFLLVAPTPEPQYLPVVLALLVVLTAHREPAPGFSVPRTVK